MNDITQHFGKLHYPSSALVFYQSKDEINNTYVEHFDFDHNGRPKNAHPLTESEGRQLAKALVTAKERENGFLNCKAIIPEKVLRIDADKKGCLLWFTKGERRQLYFSPGLEIQNGTANVPAMLWLATKKELSVFALATNHRPTENTTLLHAPFFNVYENGSVCMGSVDVDIKSSTSTEEFMQLWENYFFNSYFSHLFDGHNPVKGDAVQLWKGLIDTDVKFPKEQLKKTSFTVKHLLS
ncbi:PRTRC system protein B [Pedobacter sp. KLB.chiD]|uniref:PRTRC system protein B n=1 Tax=Pedobacter sp. KLB.chiD TaxID=3387402 RepID=UPI00399C4920